MPEVRLSFDTNVFAEMNKIRVQKGLKWRHVLVNGVYLSQEKTIVDVFTGKKVRLDSKL